jgi:tRNA threonylcarbamoyl adenosine modification protein (Sua5/YciO/YrdC/YwlC family)
VKVIELADQSGMAAVLDALGVGGVVVIPTDTIYGLAARIDRPDALRSIFDAKGRPESLALPVLVHGVEQVTSVASSWPSAADALSDRLWPGPLTLVVPALPEIGPLLGGDGTTVGVRCPDHMAMRELFGEAGPLAVTSANSHGAPPCTTAAEAVAVFEGLSSSIVELVVDGGTCDGVPSTVVDCTASPVRCLRDGGVPWETVLSSV